MRIGVVGVGAVGGLLAAGLAESGHDVVGLARGATLEALRTRGLVVRSSGADDAERVVRIEADDDAARIGPVDLLVVALKGPALAAGAAALAPLVGPRTVVLPAMNGVPWWFLPEPLASVDPDGAIGRTLPTARTLGCVVHFSASTDAPGVVRHASGDRLIVGAALPEGSSGVSASEVAAVADALGGGGFAVEVSADVRRDIWYKLWGNMTMNPVSALTGATGDRILADDLVRGFMVGAMAEAAAVGAAIGCPIEESGEERLDLARLLGPFRTSMLQDADAGRPLELGPLTGAVREIGLRVGVPTPSVDALHGLTRLMAASRGLA